ncbi:oligosaccharide flippase family protein [Acinetobacter pittii]|uniref:oligosaccharide flippase family protein n=1 Tax=Acinetobacter pittii TaxID=48296 RepID=UPI0021CDA66B|nr:oligosaccharide flippase family protein [Acinetobacter pittii]MCU4550036.1 oligosaccharide flippase family protein [Acinetobacter pittii]
MTIERPDANLLSSRTKQSVKWAYALLILKHAVTFLTMMIIARTISPYETGLANIMVTFISFLVLLDLGVSWITVQEETITEKIVNNLFWIGAIVGSGLYILCVILSGYISELYGHPELKLIIIVGALSPFFNSLSTQFSSVLKRKMLQKKNNIIDTVAFVISSLLSIFLAIKGAGYWAIIVQLVVFQFLRFIFLIKSKEFKIAKPSIDLEVVNLYFKGLNSSLNNYVTFFQLYSGTLLISYLYSPEQLAYYLKASGLKSLPTTYICMVLTDIMISSLAAININKNKGEFEKKYHAALFKVALIACPLSAFLFPLSNEAVTFFYGKNWIASVNLLEWMSIVGIMLPLSTSIIWLYISTGNYRAQLKVNIFLTFISLILYSLICSQYLSYNNIIFTEIFIYSVLIPLVTLIHSHYLLDINLKTTLYLYFSILLSSVLSSVFVYYIFIYFSLDLNFIVYGALKLMLGLLLYFVIFKVLFWSKVRGVLYVE